MLLLIAMCLCGTMVMEVFDVLLSLGYESIWSVGFKVGFVAWLAILVLQIFLKKAKKQVKPATTEK